MRPKRETAATVIYDNEDEFFTGLPDLSGRDIRGSKRLRVPKAKRIQLKLSALNARQKELDDLKAKLEMEMVDA